ncbi:MAG: fructosamine kinase family protein [Gammaproteobacteria bacterium]|nr:fructosamine kinase family protein [Gammaproteobacteria bacterium]MDH5344685.1 fructosamine kinase family protein [Gammaproteobacteria bacterium]
MPRWQRLFPILREHDIRVSSQDMPRPVGGGDISSAWRARAGDRHVFLKTGPGSAYDAFLAEADGLRELASAGAVRVPKVLGCVTSGSEALLALEWIDFGIASGETERKLGAQLAAQHRVTAERFGWHRDNTIGATPQMNAWNDDWVEFFGEQRLGFQLGLAAKNGFTGSLQADGHTLQDKLGYFFRDYWPEASLLHGDLWGGNWAAADGEPVIFDPAVYYGDRESDIAMTLLFGGFGQAFYDAYESAWPMSPGSRERIRLYQLYHVLNHLNLFGAGYLGRARELIRSIL